MFTFLLSKTLVPIVRPFLLLNDEFKLVICTVVCMCYGAKMKTMFQGVKMKTIFYGV